MRDYAQEYFEAISAYNRAEGVKKSLLKIPTQRKLEELAATVPSSSRLFGEVNKYLRVNFPQPLASTQ